MSIGICLSGGGARGIAHLGVLKALQEIGIEVSVISGVSSGAVAGAFFAAGYNPTDILHLIKELSLTQFLKPSFNRGLLHGNALRTIFEKHLGTTKFEELPLRIIISAMDLVEGNTVYLSTGPLIEALVATTSVPILFHPLKEGHRLLVDGGMVNNLPIECLQGECDNIIGVHVNYINRQAVLKNSRQISERVFHLALNENVRYRAHLCHLYLEPPALQNFHVYAIKEADAIFKIGYEYTIKLSEEIIKATQIQ